MVFSFNSTVRNILSDSRAKAIIEKHLPGATTHPQLHEVMDLTVREVSAYPESGLTHQKIQAITADLEKL